MMNRQLLAADESSATDGIFEHSKKIFRSKETANIQAFRESKRLHQGFVSHQRTGGFRIIQCKATRSIIPLHLPP